MSDQPAERPDLTGWRRRHELRKSSAAQPVPSGTDYRRKPKHPEPHEKRDNDE